MFAPYLVRGHVPSSPRYRMASRVLAPLPCQQAMGYLLHHPSYDLSPLQLTLHFLSSAPFSTLYIEEGNLVKESIGDAHAVTSPGLDYLTGQRLVQAVKRSGPSHD
jgi:hypothetical protein